jgi:hypothetical protein
MINYATRVSEFKVGRKNEGGASYLISTHTNSSRQLHIYVTTLFRTINSASNPGLRSRKQSFKIGHESEGLSISDDYRRAVRDSRTPERRQRPTAIFFCSNV